MKKRLFAVYDTCACIYMGPLIANTDSEALRDFADQANNERSKISAHPEHFILYKIGYYHDDTGEIVPIPLRSMSTAVEVLAVVDDTPIDDSGDL